MSDYRSQEAGATNARGFTLVARASGNPITTGTVNWYLKCISGANAGKWWKDSDQTWQVAETANAMTHQADGHWTRALAATPWVDGDVDLEYAKEGGDLHIPVSRTLKVEYTPTADSGRRVDASKVGGTSQTPRDLGASVLVGDKTGFSLTGGERTSIANEVEAQIIDETDTEKVLLAITNKIAAANPDLSGLTLSAIAAAVRTNLTAELARIDAAISSRNSVAPDNAGISTLLARIAGAVPLAADYSTARAGKLDLLDVAVGTRNAVAPPSAGTILAAFKADADWQAMVGDVNGNFTYDPATKVLVLKDKANAVVLATLTLTVNSSNVVTARASS